MIIMITVQHLSYSVFSGAEPLHILSDVSFTINDGQSVAIIGSSGSGKTTLLSLLAGLELPSSGLIDIDGQKISAMDEEQRAVFRAQSVGFVFQSFHLLPQLTALENVSLVLALKGDKQASTKAADYLKQVGLTHRLQHYPKQLSGGEQQRVAIARAFACQPKYLFADEPTGNLDPKTGEHIIELLFELNREQQTTLILVTHEQRLASLCQQRLHIEQGRLQ
jgi:putative ABC transport system ATP-binding protein